jgi:hypothetical protein
VRLAVATIVCGVLGAVLMVFFDAPVTRVLGVAGLFGFIVCGLFLIATPAMLSGTDDEPPPG